MGVKLLETIAIGDTKAMVAQTDKFVVVAFRGTTSRSDIRTDIQARLNVARIAVNGHCVRVHAVRLSASRTMASG
jgi:hypothetical protein